ncbi:TIGR03915 family putative DNA repair protein [Paenimyroides ceti]
MKIYVFDGSFTGLMCCIFERFEMKDSQVEIVSSIYHQPSAFDESSTIFSDEEKAKRVLKGLNKQLNKTFINSLYKAYLSEKPVAFQHIFNAAVYAFTAKTDISGDYGNFDVMGVSKIAKNVSREKHRMEAFIRFKKAQNGLFYTVIKPDFNVLPLIQHHFKNRYADQQWLIYDEQRKYGIFYDGVQVHEIELMPQEINSLLPALEVADEKESLFDQLWKDYFKSTNITERKNMKLHIQHVPKRYWKYLNEKQ